MKSASQTMACATLTAILLTACAEAGPPQVPCEGLTCEGGPCRSDLDCQMGQLCDQGECVEGEAQTACQADSDCAFAEVCTQGICEAVEGLCNRNSDCDNGELCDRDSRRCIPDDQRPCQTRQDCFSDEVSIPNFEAPPFNGSRDTDLNDAAFHPLCDGGLIVGGESDFNGSIGALIRFQIEGQGTTTCP